MSNYTQEGLSRDLASNDPRTHTQALKELASWLTSTDPLKREFAALQTSQAINKTVDTSEQASAQVRRKQIMDTFWAAHEGDGLVRNQANENQLLTWVYNNAHNQLSLDTLEQAVEALGSGLSRNPVAPPPLSPQDKLTAKLRAIRERQEWLEKQPKEVLAGIAKQEAKDRKHGIDTYADMRLTPDEQEMVKSQAKPASTSTVRVWIPGSVPKREPTRKEIFAMPAPEIRALITNGGGQLDHQKHARLNSILAGEPPVTEGQ